MYWLAYCAAIRILGARYHSGQWSKGYRLLCMAGNELRYTQEYEIDRNAIAFWLWKLKDKRHSL